MILLCIPYDALFFVLEIIKSLESEPVFERETANKNTESFK